MTGSTAESDLWGDTRRARVLLKSDSGSEWMFCGKLKPVIHYPVFISATTRKQSQVSLFSKRIPISISFTTLFYIPLCSFPGNGTKNACWCLPTSPAITSADANLEWQYFMNHEWIRKRTKYYCSILPGSIPGSHLYFRRCWRSLTTSSERQYCHNKWMDLHFLHSCH